MMSETCGTLRDPSVDRLAGHVFLARLGKKLLRPGGREATERLFALAAPQPGECVCEIAVNRAMTAMELASRFGVQVDGVDASPDFLSIARANIASRGLAERVRVHEGKGHRLPFPDSTFDAVVAEAVITMLPPDQKRTTLAEACRVLRPGGRLVIHELAWCTDSARTLRQGLVKTIQHAAWPLTDQEWRELCTDVGLRPAEAQTGPMSLLSPRGLLRDEGFGGVAGMAWNLLRSAAARKRFGEMAGFFRRHRASFHYIVLRADKPHDAGRDSSCARSE
jgi:SAM-dependent methyltransferase